MSLTDEQNEALDQKFKPGTTGSENVKFFCSNNPEKIDEILEMDEEKLNRLKVIFSESKASGNSKANFLHDHPELLTVLTSVTLAESIALIKAVREEASARVHAGRHVTEAPGHGADSGRGGRS